MAPYSPTIPQATDRPSDSQSLMLANFTAIDTVNSVNHVAFDDASGNQGKHKFVSFPVQAATPPTPPFVSGEVGMYSFLNAATNKNELYISKLNQATDTQIPFTASILSITSAPATKASGWTMLPSGLLMKWGNGTTNGVAVINNFLYDATVPFGIVYSLTLGPGVGGGGNDRKVLIHSFGAVASFDIYGTLHTNLATAAVCPFSYIAIGKPA